jgi:AcrR family transcriptional regulator
VSAKPFSSVWTRERQGRREQGLNRDQIVKAAMELLDAEGLDALSMRKLGARLGSGATSLYWYVATKDQLLELVMDEIYGLLVRLPEAATWREAANSFAYGLRGAMLEHPWCASLMGVVPGLGPNALTAADRLMGAFSDAGFTGIDIDYAVSAVMSYTLGATVPEIAWMSAMKASETDLDELQKSLIPTVEQLAAGHPNLLKQYRAYARADFDPIIARRLAFDFGLTALLDGLATRLSP